MTVAHLPRSRFDAVLFDLDGVLTATASVHVEAWRHVFDEVLRRHADETGERFVQFDPEGDYRRYVDGLPRYDGVRTFLASRGIAVPESTSDAAPDEWSVQGIGNRKNLLLQARLAAGGVEVFPGSVEVVRRLRDDGFATAVVSSSRNCAAVLEAAGIAHLFDVRVDGEVAAELHLPGKPAPDTFVEAARRLGVARQRAVVVEDALAGVDAGRRGGFGLVIGVARQATAEELLARGADVVVADLAELLDAPTAGTPVGPEAAQ